MEQNLRMISELQHFAFCRRQWALIHIEQQWQDNLRTVEGDLLHRRAHDAQQVESRGDTLIFRGLRVGSEALGMTGICDVVEFHRDPEGIALSGREGRWQVYPVEYKRGAPKEHNADALQLCAQAMCLEEMFVCEIEEGSLFYGETRRRERISLDCGLRAEVKNMLAEMRQYYERGYTPSAKPAKRCNACSLKELCLPGLKRAPLVEEYLKRHLKEDA